MKKTFAIALCVAAAGSLCAQNHDELKQLVEQGNKEFSEYDKMLLKQQIDPASVDANQMGQTLLNGYGLLMKALPLDSVPNAKGKVNPKNSKKIVNTILGHANDFFNVGGSLFNSQHYYPQAYEAFMVYADMPGVAALAKSGEQINESQRATAYFNAGLAAYSGNEVTKSAEAFKKARLNNYEQPEAYIYEIACWQSMMQKDSTLEVQAQRNINEIAKAGFDKFGIAQPVFLNNLVNSMITDNKGAEALALVKGEVEKNPENANLHGLLGFIYDRMENDAESEAAYRKAASIADADYETLLNSAKKIFRTGTEKWNLIEGNSAEAREQRNNVKVNYFEAAKAIAEKAKAIRGDKPDNTLNYLLDSIQYNLDTYFQQ